MLLAVDDGQASIGAKRQRLLEAARGDYVMAVDDDDALAPDGVAKLVEACKQGSDAVGYKSKRYRDGKYHGNCTYTITNKETNTSTIIDGVKTYLRWPMHITPVKRALALQVGFKDLNRGEDIDYQARLRPLIQTETFIDYFIYHYYWRSNRDGENTNRVQTGHR
jgi:glycosyltransferase involved in cell wall biosynthesis